MKAAALVALAMGGAALALGCQRALPPLGEAIVIVDTDLPAPRIASRLRVDLYTDDRATWYVSREIATLDPSAWPVSFSVYDPDTAAPHDVVLRLRAYQAGVVRDYRGERFAPRPPSGKAGDPAPVAPIPAGEKPRLLSSGVDITPASEPQPLVTVDRLVRIHLQPGVRGSVRLVLRGACAGTMADLEGGATCVDQENATTPIPDATLDPDLTLPTSSVQGTFGPATPCAAPVRPRTTLPDGTPLFDDEACVPGGLFVFGSAEAFGRGDPSDVPQRIALLPPFRMDVSEVTVGRWRDALSRGFSPPANEVDANDGPLDFSSITSFKPCTWSSLPMGREALPLTCVTWAAARAFCAFEGGDLPTEAQWEYVALDAGRDVKTLYPWGAELPTCPRAVYARQVSGTTVFHAADCNKLGVGLPAVEAAADPSSDVALGTGVRNLAGSVTELMLDTFASLDSACWAAQGIEAPACIDPTTQDFSLRGGSWADNAASVAGDARGDVAAGVLSPVLGFRCVRKVP